MLRKAPPSEPQTPPPPTAREHLATLLRRVAVRLPLEPALIAAVAASTEAPRESRAAVVALRAVAGLARRLHARSVDAAWTPTDLHIALHLADPAVLPGAPTRAHALALEAFGVPLVLQSGKLVSLPAPGADQPATPAAVSLARAYLARIRALEADAVLDVDPEGVHQFRVGVRRLRVVLRLLERLQPDVAVPPIVATVRAIGAVAGAVRDLDVVTEQLGDVGAPAASVASARAYLARRRLVALAKLQRTMASPRYAASMARAEAALTALQFPAAQPAIASAARTHVERELERLQRRLAADLSAPDGYHAVRRQSRRVRDSVEVFGDALRKRQRDWRARLQPVQALLGRLNDLEVARALVPATVANAADVHHAISLRRHEVLAEMGPPLALLAVALHQR